MKLVNYRCDKCLKDSEELFNRDDEIPECLEEKCSCGGEFKKWNLKNNVQVWRYLS
jgi:hypothetical protein